MKLDINTVYSDADSGVIRTSVRGGEALQEVRETLEVEWHASTLS